MYAMKNSCMLLMIIVMMAGRAFAQVGINSDSSAPPGAAMLEVKSANKGLLIPRLTLSQIQTITNPVNSLLVFCTTDDRFYAYISSAGIWKALLFGTDTIAPTCGTPFTDMRDTTVYQTIQIGTQCWMAQNLNIGTRVNGNQTQYNNSVIEKYCFGNLESNCDIYGGLYQWSEMMQYTSTPGVQGICPAGWHVPTDEEFTTLKTYLGDTVAGGRMKEAGTAHWFSPNTGATNESGFTALPGSYRNYLGGFGSDYPIGTRATFWTSTFNEPPNYDCSYNYNLYYTHGNLLRDAGAMLVNGFSVRCVKN